MLCGKVLLNLDNHFCSFTFNLWNLVQTGKHSGIKFRPYRSPPPCAFNNFKQSLQIMKTPNGADGGGIIYKKKSKLKDKRKISLGHLPVGSVPNTLLFFLCPHSAVPSFRESEGKQHQRHLTQVRGWIQDRPTLTGLIFNGRFWIERIVISEHLRTVECALIFYFFVLAFFWNNRSYTIRLRH